MDEKPHSRISLPSGVGYLFVVASGFGLAAFGLGTALARRRQPGAYSMLPPSEEPPARLAARALMWGTVWAVGGVGVVVVATGSVMHLCGIKLVRIAALSVIGIVFCCSAGNERCISFWTRSQIK